MKRAHIMLSVACGCFFANAWTGPAASVAVSPSLVALEFVDDRGRTFTTYPTATEDESVFRAYLEAEREARYSIRARNLSDERVGMVIAVDGRNIISGERSDLAHNESMYVLEPHQSAVYSGWRTSQNEVHRFYFTNIKNAYASRIGDESAMGVIAAAVYRARPAPNQVRRSPADADRAEPSAAQPLENLDKHAERSTAGTGFGESHYSRAVRVAFDPRRRPSERSFFKYEWPEQLCARGVKRCGPANRFWPISAHRFVPYPPGELR